ncbi:MAG: leucine-rich repeat domain-containing protein [Methylacidiphilales bacterium]|nr:leucine-rich repeat domain-containing protein [Candidatus Methylacidiphilales bacterium]NJR18222.1 leucine-rich repeat domain-containing protein [Calothrix sp. CSU_2_0]
MANTPPRILNQIREAKQKQLKELDLSSHPYMKEDYKLKQIPAEVFELEWLEKLDLSGNDIAKIPNLLTHFRNLRFFGFRWQKNHPIPDWINQVSQLKVDLSRFNISDTLPDFIFSLPNLTSLDLRDNPLENPPLEVAEKGIEAIREYFRQLAEGKDYLYEAKLLILPLISNLMDIFKRNQ